MSSSRQHRSATTGQWVPCNASVRPCPREHRQEPSAEREAFYADIAGQQVLTGLQAQAQRVLDDYSELSFRSNSFHGAVGARLRLWELEDGSVGQGNCARATSALLAALPHDTFDEGQSARSSSKAPAYYS